MTKTIVVPVDGSELGERALPWAASLARQLGLSLTLARIVPWPEIPAGEFGGYISAEVYDDVLAADRQSTSEYLARLQSEWSARGLTVRTVMRDGMAAEGILDVADEVGAYAVAMASHGRSGMVRLVMGSVAERIVQQATIPVFLTRAGEASGTESLRQILVPLDGSALAERGLDQARELVTKDSVLILERVVEPIYEMLGSDTAALVVDEQATQKAEVNARQYLDGITQQLAVENVRSLARVRRGRPATEILNEVKESGVDVIVMTTHGHTGPARWLMGSVADEVFRTSEHPVLLVSVRTVAARLTGAASVRDVMTRDVELVSEDEPIVSVIRKLLRRRVSGAPVADTHGKLIGVITEHDLLNWHREVIAELAKDEANLIPAKYAERMETQSIASLVTSPAVAIDASADLNAAIRMLSEHGLRRLPVTDDGRLVGIIARADILKGMAEHWRQTTQSSETTTSPEPAVAPSAARG